MKTKDLPIKTITAIIAILILDITALIVGIDGKYLLVGILAIAGLGGYPLIQALLKK